MFYVMNTNTTTLLLTQSKYGYRLDCYVHRRRICENGHGMLYLQLQINGRQVTVVAEETSNCEHLVYATTIVQRYTPLSQFRKQKITLSRCLFTGSAKNIRLFTLQVSVE